MLKNFKGKPEVAFLLLHSFCFFSGQIDIWQAVFPFLGLFKKKKKNQINTNREPKFSPQSFLKILNYEQLFPWNYLFNNFPAKMS
jgi:hypothetical protein